MATKKAGAGLFNGMQMQAEFVTRLDDLDEAAKKEVIEWAKRQQQTPNYKEAEVRAAFDKVIAVCVDIVDLNPDIIQRLPNIPNTKRGTFDLLAELRAALREHYGVFTEGHGCKPY